jgi:hypothetical protein
MTMYVPAKPSTVGRLRTLGGGCLRGQAKWLVHVESMNPRLVSNVQALSHKVDGSVPPKNVFDDRPATG